MYNTEEIYVAPELVEHGNFVYNTRGSATGASLESTGGSPALPNRASGAGSSVETANANESASGGNVTITS
jgi:hypothetical protein